MGQWTIVIHGTGAHHNWATVDDPSKPAGQGYSLITGRKNAYDADLMFAEFVDALKAGGHTLTGSTFTHGGMEGPDNVVRADYQNPRLPPKPKTKKWVPTLLELTYGSDHEQEQRRYFHFDQQSDALVRMSEAICERDSNPKIHAAYVHLKRLPDTIFPEGMSIAGWTKTSDERPTADGALAPELVA
jgi:hypothetical protein